jgi:hypothetical protein
MDPALKNEVERLVADIVAGRFSQLVADGRAGRLSEAELQKAVLDYGRTLVPLPEAAWAVVDEFPQKTDPSMVAVDVPLWTAEEGRSDLTLTLTAQRHPTGLYCLRIDDLHVL